MTSTTTRRAAAAIATALAATTFLTVTGTARAAATCTPADPPPQVLAVTAEDISFGSGRQSIRVTVRNPCGGGAVYECSNDPSTTCTGLSLKLRRAEPVGSSASYCAHWRSTDGDADGSGPVATAGPGVYDSPLSLSWSLQALDDPEQPAMTNACSGPWDVVVVPYNHIKVDYRYTVSRGPEFTALKAFSLLRVARLTTDASPEPVRRGATVTVTGRLTRQMLARDRLSTHGGGSTYVALAATSVVLQRRTHSGDYTSLRTVRSDGSGRLSARLKALPGDRCYRWTFRGTDPTGAVTSGGDSVHVRR
jgi:hypothetical protein